MTRKLQRGLNINLKDKIIHLQKPGAAKDLLTQSQQDFPSNITNHFHTHIKICNERSLSRSLNVHWDDAHNSICHLYLNLRT